MKIQNLSIAVPGHRCINQCATCPSRMHDNAYPILIDDALPDFDLYMRDYIKRMEFARKNGCNTLMLTGTLEPQQNRRFLMFLGMMMQMMGDPFQCIEMQTTGVLIDKDYLAFLRRHIGLTLMALSVFSLNKKENEDIIHTPNGAHIDVPWLAKSVKESGMSLRMCLNLTEYFDMFRYEPEMLFKVMKEEYGADQVTLRVLYANDLDPSAEARYVREHRASDETVAGLKHYITTFGKLLGRLSYGAYKYSVNGMSIVLDSDSMGKESEDLENYKYLILRPDCKLYSSWDDPASLVF